MKKYLILQHTLMSRTDELTNYLYKISPPPDTQKQEENGHDKGETSIGLGHPLSQNMLAKPRP